MNMEIFFPPIVQGINMDVMEIHTLITGEHAGHICIFDRISFEISAARS